MNKSRLVVATLLIAVALTACKSGGDVSTFNTLKGKTSTTDTDAVYGTPVTLADGTPVTLADGTPVTRGGTGGTSSGGATTTEAPVKTVTTLASADLVKETGTTAVTTKPDTDHLAMPKAGEYRFRDTTNGQANDVYYDITLSGPVVRFQQSRVITSGKSFYEETHRSDGLFLTNSNISGSDCKWSPVAASLPQSVIDGGSASTKSHCETSVGTQAYKFDLSLDLAFKRLRTVTIGGTQYKCIDVTRKRVLTDGTFTETVTATDTYAFNLGLRFETDESVARQDEKGGKTETHAHHSVMTALP